MKRFIKKLIFFLSPIVLLSIPLDYFLSQNLKKSVTYEADEFAVWNDIYAHKINADIAVYGSSRAWVHIDPQMLEDSLHKSAYNLGIDGHNFWLQYLRHTELLKHDRQPKCIILSLDMFTLQKRKDLYNPDQFLPYMLWNKNIYAYTSSYQSYEFYDYFLPFLRYANKRDAINLAVKNALFPVDTSEERKKGFKGVNSAWNDDLEAAKAAMKYYEVQVDEPTILLFDKFLAACKNNGTAVIFVYTPEYKEGQDFVKNRKKIISIFQKFADKYTIPFLDYSADTMCGQKKYFYNASHLNKTGAELFTSKLISDLRNTKVLHN